MAGQFGIPPRPAFIASLAVISGALGKSVRLRSSLWPKPVNAALQWLFVDATQGRLPQALDFLTEPLSDFQDTRRRNLSPGVRRRLEEQLEFDQQREGSSSCLETGCDPRDRTKRIGLELRLHPVRLLRDSPPGSLAQGVTRSGDQAVLALYTPMGAHRMCHAAAGKRSADLLSLERGWHGQTQISLSRSQRDDVHLLEPAISSIILYPGDDLSPLLEEEPSAGTLLGRMLSLKVAVPAGSPSVRGFTLESLQQWREAIDQLLCFRESGHRDLLQLAPNAAACLAAYRAECLRAGSPEQPDWLAALGPLLAAKLSIAYQVALSPRPFEISLSAMDGAIQLTRFLVRKDAMLE